MVVMVGMIQSWAMVLYMDIGEGVQLHTCSNTKLIFQKFYIFRLLKSTRLVSHKSGEQSALDGDEVLGGRWRKERVVTQVAPSL